jgi:hypothetical protein
MRKVTVLAVLTASTAVAFGASAPASAQNNSNQVGLVNVSVGDVDVLNDVNLAVAADLAATICGLDVPIAVLAGQLIADGSETVCNTAAGPVTVDQSQTSGGGGANAGGNNARQAGLVNVAAGDIAILNNVNLAVAAQVVATVCDVTIPVALLAQQVLVDGSQTFCSTAAGPITVDQAQGGGGSNGGTGGGNNARQAGLVNVALGDVALLNDVNAAVAATVAATVCDLNVPVAVLARQVIADGSATRPPPPPTTRRGIRSEWLLGHCVQGTSPVLR